MTWHGLTASGLTARALFSDDDRDLVDEYAAEYPQHAYHVVAAFVLNGDEPPHDPAYTGTQMVTIIAPHYAKYRPNGTDDDGLGDVGSLEAKR